MTNKKNVAINIVMNWITFAINILIGLIITPRIISMINAEAYGYVGLANSMTNYITIITVALNSMAGRFISVKLFEDKKEEANKYFATTFYANLFCVGLITICSIPIIFSLDKIIVIPDYLINDVKWLYTFTLANFCISLITTAFSVSTFVTNQLYKSSIIQGMLTLARAFLLAFIYYNNQTKIFYWGLVNLICAVVSLSIYIYYTKKLTPVLQIRVTNYSSSIFAELIKSGIWNSISKIAQTLSDGLDLLITNLWISTIAMGQLNLAKIFSGYVSSFLGTVISAFCPELTQKYALGEKKELVEELKVSMRLCSFIANIPFLLMVLWGREFFELWVPQEDSIVLHKLAILSIQGVLVSGVTSTLNNVFIITNRVKGNACFWISVSFFDLAVVVSLLNFTNYGIYAVAGVSTTVGIFANLFFVPLYASHCLGVPGYIFYRTIMQYMFTSIILLIGLYKLKLCLAYDNGWMNLISMCIVTCILILLANYFCLLKSEDRELLWRKIRK